MKRTPPDGIVSQALGERLGMLRQAMALSVRDVARAAGLTQAALRRIEAGALVPDADQLSALAGALWIPASALLGERRQHVTWLREPRRRPNGASTVYLGADGYWHGRVSMGKTASGRPDRRHVCGRSEAGVRARVAELERERALMGV